MVWSPDYSSRPLTPSRRLVGVDKKRDLPYTVITEHSQVTLPIEVRRVLGLKPRDQVAFTINDGEVRLVSVAFTLESAYGSVEPLNRPEDFERITDEAKAEKARHSAGPKR